MKKRLLALSLSVVMLLSLAACGGGQTSSTTTPAGSGSQSAAPAGSESASGGGGDILVGHFGPLTGSISLSGQEGEKGARLRIKQINEAGGINGQQLTFIAYDDKGTPEAAVKAATRLVEEDKVHVILGSQLSANVQAAGERVEAAQTPLVGTGVGPVWLQNGWKYLFRALSNSAGGAAPLVDAMETLGTTRMATIVYQDEGSRSGASQVVEEMKRRGKIEITAEEVFQPNDTDWTGQFSRMIATNPDGIMLFVQGEHAGPMLKQLRSLGYSGYVYGPETMSLPDIRKVAGDAANGMVFFAPHCIPDSVEEANSDKERAFLEAFIAEYGAMPVSDVAYRTYDAVTILEEGLRNAESLDGPAIRDAIKNISGLEVLAGTIDYTQYDNGEGMSGMQIFITHGGKNILFSNYIGSNAPDTYTP